MTAQLFMHIFFNTSNKPWLCCIKPKDTQRNFLTLEWRSNQIPLELVSPPSNTGRGIDILCQPVKIPTYAISRLFLSENRTKKVSRRRSKTRLHGSNTLKLIYEVRIRNPTCAMILVGTKPFPISSKILNKKYRPCQPA